MIELIDFGKDYGDFTAVERLSFKIEAGELFGFIGPNGAGKSTMLKALLGFVKPDTGRMSVLGMDVAQRPLEIRARIGYMPEDRRLIGTLTTEDNILLPAWASGLERAEDRLAYIYRVMPEVQAMAGRRASQLSGGQQKMVALARALMSGTKLLLLDEPFEGLSPAMGERLAGTILALQRDGLSVLMAESDRKRIAFAQTLYTIERGEIVPSTAV